MTLGPPGVGAGALSPEAAERLSRGVEGEGEPPPPPMNDLEAVAAWRAVVNAAWSAGDPPPATVGHHPEVLGGVRCFRTGAVGTVGTIVYFHGGGYCLGSPEVAVPITSRLGSAEEVVSVDYRLAPEHPCPAAIDDGLSVYRALCQDRPGCPIALVGDSAGAGIALAITVQLRDQGAELPRALALLSPHLDHGDGGGERAGVGGWFSRAYCGERDPADPVVSPLRADPGGLPPVLVQVAGSERLFGQSVRFARRARISGVDVVLDVWDGLWHTWHYHRTPEADLALQEAGSFLHTHLSGPATG